MSIDEQQPKKGRKSSTSSTKKTTKDTKGANKPVPVSDSKKPKTIINIQGGSGSLSGENTVQMAKLLYKQLFATELNLSTLKLIDVYLSRINSHDPENKTVVFEKGELEALFGVKRIQREALNSYLKEMLTINVVLTAEEEDDKQVEVKAKSLLLFDTATLTQDKEDLLWKVEIKCGDDAEKLIFNIDKMGYLQHSVQNSARIRNYTTLVLFKFIEDRRNNKGTYPQEFEITVEELRKALNCVDKYTDMKMFSDRCLKKPREEILEKTDCRFDITPIRRGRKIYKYKFTIYDRVKLLDSKKEEAAPESADGVVIEVEGVDKGSPAHDHYYYGNEYDEQGGAEGREIFTAQSMKKIKLLAAACDNEFSPQQMELLFNLISFYIDDQRRIYNYLRKMYEKLNGISEMSEKPQKERFDYFRKMIEDDEELPTLG